MFASHIIENRTLHSVDKMFLHFWFWFLIISIADALTLVTSRLLPLVCAWGCIVSFELVHEFTVSRLISSRHVTSTPPHLRMRLYRFFWVQIHEFTVSRLIPHVTITPPRLRMRLYRFFWVNSRVYSVCHEYRHVTITPPRLRMRLYRFFWVNSRVYSVCHVTSWLLPSSAHEAVSLLSEFKFTSLWCHG